VRHKLLVEGGKRTFGEPSSADETRLGPKRADYGKEEAQGGPGLAAVERHARTRGAGAIGGPGYGDHAKATSRPRHARSQRTKAIGSGIDVG